MNYYTKLLYLPKIKEKLLDEVSKKLFDIRVDYMVMRNNDSYISAVSPFLENLCCLELSYLYRGGRS